MVCRDGQVLGSLGARELRSDRRVVLLIAFDNVKPELCFDRIARCVDFERKGRIAEGFGHVLRLELAHTAEPVERGRVV